MCARGAEVSLTSPLPPGTAGICRRAGRGGGVRVEGGIWVCRDAQGCAGMSKYDHAESAASWERIEMPGASVEERPRRERARAGGLR